MLLDFVEEAGTQLGIGNALAGGDNQIALAPDRHQASLRAPVTVRGREVLYRQTSHDKVLQHPVFDDFDARRWDSFIVVAIPAGQFRARERAQGGVVGHTEKIRQNFFTDLLGECLAFLAPPLALSFDAMAENFVEEHGRRPA